MKKMITLLAIAGMVLALAPTAQAQWTESAVSPFTGAANDRLGDDAGMDLSGTTGIISSFQNGGNAFVFDTTTGASFALAPSVAGSNWGIGSAVNAVTGLAVVGAQSGGTDLYDLNGATPGTPVHTIAQNSSAAAISGTTLAIGQVGTIRLYDVSTITSPVFLGQVDGASYGRRNQEMALDGNTLAVSRAGGNAPPDYGAWLYDLADLDVNTPLTEASPNTIELIPSETTQNRYGESIDIDGGRVIVGDAKNTLAEGTAPPTIGSAWLFDTAGNNLGRIIPSATADLRAGEGVGISGDVVLIGAIHGEVNFYNISGDSSTWAATEEKFNDGSTDDRYGRTVAIDGNVALVAAGRYGASDTGAAFIYTAASSSTSTPGTLIFGQ
jgi:hypothetical protein